MPTIYLIRHAEPERYWNGDDDSRPLSVRGRKQAQWMGEHLLKAGITELRTAPHARCRQTAELIGAALGIKPVIDEDLRIDRSFRVNPGTGTALWVAHSNNIPGAMRAIGVACHACSHASAWKVELDEQGNATGYEYIEPEV